MYIDKKKIDDYVPKSIFKDDSFAKSAKDDSFAKGAEISKNNFYKPQKFVPKEIGPKPVKEQVTELGEDDYALRNGYVEDGDGLLKRGWGDADKSRGNLDGIEKEVKEGATAVGKEATEILKLGNGLFKERKRWIFFKHERNSNEFKALFGEYKEFLKNREQNRIKNLKTTAKNYWQHVVDKHSLSEKGLDANLGVYADDYTGNGKKSLNNDSFDRVSDNRWRKELQFAARIYNLMQKKENEPHDNDVKQRHQNAETQAQEKYEREMTTYNNQVNENATNEKFFSDRNSAFADLKTGVKVKLKKHHEDTDLNKETGFEKIDRQHRGELSSRPTLDGKGKVPDRHFTINKDKEPKNLEDIGGKTNKMVKERAQGKLKKLLDSLRDSIKTKTVDATREAGEYKQKQLLAELESLEKELPLLEEEAKKAQEFVLLLRKQCTLLKAQVNNYEIDINNYNNRIEDLKIFGSIHELAEKEGSYFSYLKEFAKMKYLVRNLLKAQRRRFDIGFFVNVSGINNSRKANKGKEYQFEKNFFHYHENPAKKLDDSEKVHEELSTLMGKKFNEGDFKKAIAWYNEIWKEHKKYTQTKEEKDYYREVVGGVPLLGDTLDNTLYRDIDRYCRNEIKKSSGEDYDKSISEDFRPRPDTLKVLDDKSGELVNFEPKTFSLPGGNLDMSYFSNTKSKSEVLSGLIERFVRDREKLEPGNEVPALDYMEQYIFLRQTVSGGKQDKLYNCISTYFASETFVRKLKNEFYGRVPKDNGNKELILGLINKEAPYEYLDKIIKVPVVTGKKTSKETDMKTGLAAAGVSLTGSADIFDKAEFLSKLFSERNFMTAVRNKAEELKNASTTKKSDAETGLEEVSLKYEGIKDMYDSEYKKSEDLNGRVAGKKDRIEKIKEALKKYGK